LKRIAIVALIAVATTGLLSRPAFAGSTPIASSKLLFELAVGSANEKDLNALFNAVGITATSTSVSAGLGSFSFIDAKASTKVTKQLEYTVFGGSHTLALSLGSRREILGISIQPIRPPTSRPIPETRTLLLYGLGALTIGWVVVRSRRASAARAH
jgi:hypothetical protein